jgi:hypothetical protein
MQNKWSLRLKCEKLKTHAKNEKVKKLRGQNVLIIHAMWTIKKGKKGCLFVSMLKLAPIVFFLFLK